ncbi:hypothetical protein ACLI50_22680, partial [Chryseobacterium sp. EZn1]
MKLLKPKAAASALYGERGLNGVIVITTKNGKVEVQLYRIIQEFTTNVIKHSDATDIWIYMKDYPDNMAVVIS